MYRIMIVKSKKNEEYLYQFLLATKKDLATGLDVLAPVELATVGELDSYVEKMLNEDGYAKSDFIIVKCIDYTIDAKDYSDAEPEQAEGVEGE